MTTPPRQPTIAPSVDGADRGPWWVIARLVRNQPVRWTTSLLVWVSIWTVPIVLGFIAEAFFDGLTGDGGWSIRTVVAALAAYLVGYLGLMFLGMRLHASLMVRARTAVMRRMLGWIFGLPAAQPVAETPGEVVSRFRDDTEHLQEAFDFSVDFIGASVSAAVAFAVLVAVDPLFTLVVTVPIVLVVVVVTLLGRRIKEYRRAARETTEEVTGFLGETFGAAAAVKVAGAEAPLLARFDRLNERRRRMMVRDRTLTAATDALVHNTADVAVGIVLVLAAGAIGAAGPQGLSVGEIALFTILLGRAVFGAYMTGQFLARLRQAGVSIDRMVALLPGAGVDDLVVHQQLEGPDDGTRGSGPPHTPSRRRRAMPSSPAPAAALLELRGATARYPGTTAGVEDVDLAVHRGQLVVVTGRVGSGKTTLLRAALGLLPLDDGELRWEGEPVEDPAAALGPPLTAYTPQVPRLFSMDLRDNLAMGAPVDDELVHAAIAAATLDADLAAMPHGLGTMVGPRGLRLSGGQVQRAAAARMLVRDPQLLVFDDLSSALDVETEATLWERLFAPGRDTTALVVSHRRPALAAADLVVVLDHGRVAASGPATDLLATSPLFRELWD